MASPTLAPLFQQQVSVRCVLSETLTGFWLEAFDDGDLAGTVQRCAFLRSGNALCIAAICSLDCSVLPFLKLAGLLAVIARLDSLSCHYIELHGACYGSTVVTTAEYLRLWSDCWSCMASSQVCYFGCFDLQIDYVVALLGQILVATICNLAWAAGSLLSRVQVWSAGDDMRMGLLGFVCLGEDLSPYPYCMLHIGYSAVDLLLRMASLLMRFVFASVILLLMESMLLSATLEGDPSL
ncbi:hypothetical protein NC651_036777 [Populus alba x Populus x berolinensis]|nr:hypothetical protein NC651_036777 [Populus alba x Populus x berolinensis]